MCATGTSRPPGTAVEVKWDGKGDGGVGSPGPTFRVEGRGSAASAADSFCFADHLFPIRGRHDLGQSETNNFGGGRGHQGQDMFARCGTKLALARGGKVQYAGFHGAAGNYVVVDTAGTRIDHVYMHLRESPLVRTGDRVFTGQKIGDVGDTGRATGCHLHFEMWTAPGWYEAGGPSTRCPRSRAGTPSPSEARARASSPPTLSGPRTGVIYLSRGTRKADLDRRHSLRKMPGVALSPPARPQDRSRRRPGLIARADVAGA